MKFYKNSIFHRLLCDIIIFLALLFMLNYLTTKNVFCNEIFENDVFLDKKDNIIENDTIKSNDFLSRYNLIDKYLEPKISIFDQNNVATTLKELRGKYVIINFFALWCLGCKSELQALDKLQGELNFLDIKNYVILPLSIDYKNSEEISAFINSLELKNLNYYIDKNKKVMAQLGVKSLPTTILIDQHGYVIKKIDHNINWDKKEIINNMIDIFEGRITDSVSQDRKKYYQSDSQADITYQKESSNSVTIIN